MPSLEWTYPPTPEAVRDARWHCVHYLDLVLSGPPDAVENVLDDARLMVSELMTHAIQAHASEVKLRISAGAGCVRIEVVDNGTGASPRTTIDRDRARRIVEHVARRWGVRELPRGREVWAECSLVDQVVVVDDRSPAHEDGQDEAGHRRQHADAPAA